MHDMPGTGFAALRAADDDAISPHVHVPYLVCAAFAHGHVPFNPGNFVHTLGQAERFSQADRGGLDIPT